MSPLADALQAQQHANQAQQSKKEIPLWAEQVAAYSSFSSTALAAKRLHPYRKQFKLLHQSQRCAKKNSKRKQHMNRYNFRQQSLALVCVCSANELQGRQEQSIYLLQLQRQRCQKLLACKETEVFCKDSSSVSPALSSQLCKHGNQTESNSNF